MEVEGGFSFQLPEAGLAFTVAPGRMTLVSGAWPAAPGGKAQADELLATGADHGAGLWGWVRPAPETGPAIEGLERVTFGMDFAEALRCETVLSFADEAAAIRADARRGANTVVRERCRIGRRVILHQNVSIGADGFGYWASPEGTELLKVPQIGTVAIEDGVEVGANSCVDRGKFGATIIGAETKIDNLVQIGHNCRIGRSCVIAALTGLGGSVIMGDHVRVGGAVGIADHVRIGDGATIGAKSGVMRDIPDGTTVLGTPANEVQKTLRQWAATRKLPDWMQRVSRFLKVTQP